MKSWNPFEILADVVEGKIFDGEPEVLKEASNGNEASGQTPRKQEQAEGTKRKPASESLAESFKPVTSAASAAAASVAESASDTSAEGTGLVSEESEGSGASK